MPFTRSYDFDILKNEAERLVLAELERQLDSRESVCVCEECVLDMAAFALNAVKPLYRVSLLGSMYAAHAMDEASYGNALRQAVSQAIDRVSENPSHD